MYSADWTGGISAGLVIKTDFRASNAFCCLGLHLTFSGFACDWLSYYLIISQVIIAQKSENLAHLSLGLSNSKIALILSSSRPLICVQDILVDFEQSNIFRHWPSNVLAVVFRVCEPRASPIFLRISLSSRCDFAWSCTSWSILSIIRWRMLGLVFNPKGLHFQAKLPKKHLKLVYLTESSISKMLASGLWWTQPSAAGLHNYYFPVFWLFGADLTIHQIIIFR